MDGDDVIIAACATITLSSAIGMYSNLSKPNKKRIRKKWMKDWLLEREVKGAYSNIVQELRLQDHEHFRKYLHMSTTTFEIIFSFPFFNDGLFPVKINSSKNYFIAWKLSGMKISWSF